MARIHAVWYPWAAGVVSGVGSYRAFDASAFHYSCTAGVFPSTGTLEVAFPEGKGLPISSGDFLVVTLTDDSENFFETDLLRVEAAKYDPNESYGVYTFSDSRFLFLNLKPISAGPFNSTQDSAGGYTSKMYDGYSWSLLATRSTLDPAFKDVRSYETDKYKKTSADILICTLLTHIQRLTENMDLPAVPMVWQSIRELAKSLPTLDVFLHNVVWEAQDPATTLNDLLHTLGLTLGYRIDGQMKVFGTIDYTDTDFSPVHAQTVQLLTDEKFRGSFLISEQISAEKNPNYYDRIMVVGGRTIVQDVLSGLLPMGVDTDGSWKQIDDLSYKPAVGAWVTHATMDPPFPKLDNPAKQLAQAHIYKSFILAASDFDKLPLLTELAETSSFSITVDGSTIRRVEQQKPYMTADCVARNANNKLETVSDKRIEGITINEFGVLTVKSDFPIVSLASPAGVGAQGFIIQSNVFAPVTDMTLTVAYEKKPFQITDADRDGVTPEVASYPLDGTKYEIDTILGKLSTTLGLNYIKVFKPKRTQSYVPIEQLDAVSARPVLVPQLNPYRWKVIRADGLVLYEQRSAGVLTGYYNKYALDKKASELAEPYVNATPVFILEDISLAGMHMLMTDALIKNVSYDTKSWSTQVTIDPNVDPIERAIEDLASSQRMISNNIRRFVSKFKYAALQPLEIHK